MRIIISTIFDKQRLLCLQYVLARSVHSNAADSREGGPSVTRGGYLLTQWNMTTLLVGRSVVI